MDAIATDHEEGVLVGRHVPGTYLRGLPYLCLSMVLMAVLLFFFVPQMPVWGTAGVVGVIFVPTVLICLRLERRHAGRRVEMDAGERTIEFTGFGLGRSGGSADGESVVVRFDEVERVFIRRAHRSDGVAFIVRTSDGKRRRIVLPHSLDRWIELRILVERHFADRAEEPWFDRRSALLMVGIFVGFFVLLVVGVIAAAMWEWHRLG